MNNKALSWNKRADREKIVRILKAGGVVAGSSDTVPGLLTGATQEGKKVLDSIKKRSDKSYLVLISSQDKLLDVVALEQFLQIEKLIDRCWPGPLTLILTAKPGTPQFLLSKKNTIAVRVPDHDGLRDVLEQFPALFSTSANKAGQPVPETVGSIDQDIKNQVAALIANGDKVSLPSTLVDCTQEVPQVIREGAYPVEKIEEILGRKVEQ